MILAALDRTSRSYATDFLTEPLAMLLTQLWLWCICELAGVWPRSHCAHDLVADDKRRTWLWAASAGLLLALVIATRSVIVFWLPGIWLMIWLATRLRTATAVTRPVNTSRLSDQSKSGTRLATLVLASSILFCMPWWLRNCWQLDTFMPLGTQGSISLIGGYNDEALQAAGEWQHSAELRLRERVEDGAGDLQGRKVLEREVRVSREASRAVWSWIRQHWPELPRLAWLRVKTEWNPYTGRALLWKVAALLGLVWLVLLCPRAAAVLGGIVLINTLTVMLLYSVGGRFLVPIYGVLYSLAGIGVACTSERIARRLLLQG
jgi:hypothetical protein